MFASAPNASIPNASSGSLQINSGGPMASYPNAAAPVAGRVAEGGGTGGSIIAKFAEWLTRARRRGSR